MSAPKALIFHGTYGSEKENWFPWLQEELMMAGWQVAVPTLPTPEGQSLENWKQALKEQVSSFREADVLIGHSCGGSFALRLLEEGLIQPKQTILAGAIINVMNNEFDELVKTFIDRPFNWSTIKENCDNTIIFHGDNDPYVPLSQAETISTKLDAPLHIVKGGGHINAEAGYTKFPEILDIIDAE